MFLNILLMLAIVGAGMLVSCQGAANAGLAQRLGLGPALVVNTVVVLTGCLAVFLAGGGSRNFFPGHIPFYYYLGGIGGFAFIVANAFILPKLGAGPAVALAVLGQGAAALAIDHYGLFGVPRQPTSLPHIAGFGLIVLGVALLRR
ncbi:MAG: hypothetical protein RJA22_2699 [Verrucomicrobiota bacterium]|jgi:transporter family-2 protein